MASRLPWVNLVQVLLHVQLSVVEIITPKTNPIYWANGLSGHKYPNLHTGRTPSSMCTWFRHQLKSLVCRSKFQQEHDMLHIKIPLHSSRALAKSYVRGAPVVDYRWTNRLSLRNNRWKFETSGELPTILEVSIEEYYPEMNENKTGRPATSCSYSQMPQTRIGLIVPHPHYAFQPPHQCSNLKSAMPFKPDLALQNIPLSK